MKILVVEDEKKIAESIKKGLTIEGYSVDIASTGLQALSLIEDSTHNLIVLDIMLPGLSGLEVLKKLRNTNNNIPVLMLSAKSETEDKILGLNIGADDYLSKPFSFDELLARIKALLRRPLELNNEFLSLEDLKLNLTTFEVERNGEIIPLSKKEFQLLEFLLRNKGKTVSKDKIINSVWEYESDILPNTVEVFIGYLRNKIDKPFQKQLITTVRGFGYRLG
jgi:DNA-binding response OmpR family regulator